MITVLSDATAVHKKLKDMFSRRTRAQRRVIVVAYVGRDACTLLPDYKGVELYCWPQTGATDPYALADLRSTRYGARIRLVDHLHMKLYWAQHEGFVITSANLSRRALGDTVQEEIGIFCDDPSNISIDEIVHRLKSRRLKAPELQQLQERHDEYWASVPRTNGNGKPRKSGGFEEWYRSDRLPRWKFGWWDGHDDESESTAELAHQRYDVTEIDDFIPCERGQLKRNDWVLCFRLSRNGRVSSPSWLRVDFVNTVTGPERTKKGYDQEAVQLRPLTPEHRPPFSISLEALRKTVDNFGTDRIRTAKDLTPSRAFLTAFLRASK
jgi:hypothetical protein